MVADIRVATGIEFSAELHDIVTEDMTKLYPELVKYHKITVYDVAPSVLSMFDEKLTKYATESFQRDSIEILTSHHVEELRVGAPQSMKENHDIKDSATCYTLKLKEEGETAVGMCIWSTGLMVNPFVQKAMSEPVKLPVDSSIVLEQSRNPGDMWSVRKDPKSGGVMTDDRLRLMLQPQSQNDTQGDSSAAGKAVLKDVFGLGDCAIMEDLSLIHI